MFYVIYIRAFRSQSSSEVIFYLASWTTCDSLITYGRSNSYLEYVPGTETSGFCVWYDLRTDPGVRRYDVRVRSVGVRIQHIIGFVNLVMILYAFESEFWSLQYPVRSSIIEYLPFLSSFLIFEGTGYMVYCLMSYTL